jgi:uncharacterized protein YjbI with pentapeptide repeats
MTQRAAFILSLLMAIILILSDAKSSTDLLFVPAEEVISQVRDGQPVYYEGVFIVGDLFLDEPAEMVVKSPFVIINSTVENASFDGVSFQKDAIFWGTAFGNASFNGTGFSRADFSDTYFGKGSFTGATFSYPASFDEAFFRGDASFIGSRFMKDASFIGARFLEDADFNYSGFDYYTYFSNAQFLGNASFSDITFSGTLDFSAANFTRAANFFQSKFEDAAVFSDVVFWGPAQFGICEFSGLSSFGSAIFAGDAGFNMARFDDDAYFSGARFQGDALFGLVEFEDLSTFQGASFGRELNLKGSRISTMLLDGAVFGEKCKIRLNDSDFARLSAPWAEIDGHMIYNAGAFLALIENYRRMGWSRDEDECYYDYRSINQAERDWGWMKLLDAAAWISCGYGVRPGYAVLWSLLTIVLFAMIFWMGDGIRRSSRPFQGAEMDPVPERATLRNALFFSTMIFLSQGPIDFLPVGRHRYYVILEGILGWLLLALFLVTLGRVMIR